MWVSSLFAILLSGIACAAIAGLKELSKVQEEANRLFLLRPRVVAGFCIGAAVTSASFAIAMLVHGSIGRVFIPSTLTESIACAFFAAVGYLFLAGTN